MPKKQGYRLKVAGYRISSWVKLVENIKKTMWKFGSLYSLSTKDSNYLTSQLIILNNFLIVYRQLIYTLQQIKFTFSTLLINKTNLIK